MPLAVTPLITGDPEWVDRVTWAADRLARIYMRGFEIGLRGEKLSVPLEGSPDMWAAEKRGYTAGLVRRAEIGGPVMRIAPLGVSPAPAGINPFRIRRPRSTVGPIPNGS